MSIRRACWRLSKAYQEVFRNSIANREAFWKDAAHNIKWNSFPQQILDFPSSADWTWFKDGRLSMYENCMAHDPKKIAFISHDSYSRAVKYYTYGDFRELVERCASSMYSRGLRKGDTIVIYMPMIVEAAVVMLACQKLGITHSVVFAGFAAPELAKRIQACGAKALFTASHGFLPKRPPLEYIPIVDAALELCAEKPLVTVVVQRESLPKHSLKSGEEDWDEFMKTSPGPIPSEVLDSSHPSFILYTSGTTGSPKGIVRDTGGYAVALKWSMKNIYGASPNDVFWAASDIGWIVGHSYCIYGPLLMGCTSVIFDGKPVGTPDASEWWNVINAYNVNILFAAPTGFRAIKKEDSRGDHINCTLKSLRRIFVAGERCDPATLLWLSGLMKAKKKIDSNIVFDHYWQTETGWPILGPCVGLGMEDYRVGSCGLPVPGYDVVAMPDNETEDDLHKISVRLPLPPGCFNQLHNDPTKERFINSYIDVEGGYYKTGDAGYKDKDGFFFVVTRTDDVINVAGHRLGTSNMEEVVASHPAVAECAVFGVSDKLKGQIPGCVVVLKGGLEKTKEVVEQEIVSEVRKIIGSIADFKLVKFAERLPKTRSGKILRKELSRIAAGEGYVTPQTIEDDTVLNEIHQLFGTMNPGVESTSGAAAAQK